MSAFTPYPPLTAAHNFGRNSCAARGAEIRPDNVGDFGARPSTLGYHGRRQVKNYCGFGMLSCGRGFGFERSCAGRFSR